MSFQREKRSLPLERQKLLIRAANEGRNATSAALISILSLYGLAVRSESIHSEVRLKAVSVRFLNFVGGTLVVWVMAIAASAASHAKVSSSEQACRVLKRVAIHFHLSRHDREGLYYCDSLGDMLCGECLGQVQMSTFQLS